MASQNRYYLHLRPKYTTIFTDGSCLGQGGQNRNRWRAGCGIYIPSLGLKISQPLMLAGEQSRSQIQPTNNRAELTSVIRAVNQFPTGSYLEIVTDSQYTVLIFGSTGLKYQQQGYRLKTGNGQKEVPNADLVRQAVALTRQYHLRFRLVKAHQTGELDFYGLGNQIADQLAQAGANKVD